MTIDIINEPIRFRLHGLSATVDNNRYGEVGCKLMDQMWKTVKDAGIKNGGINHWVYFADDRMFVGIEISDTPPVDFETVEFEIPRYAKHLHIGQYSELFQKWQSLKAELTARGETITLPSLEIYGHACEGEGDQPETTIVLGLKA